MTATGDMMGVYRAMTKGEKLTAHLSLTSDLIDCNQLINSLSFPEDTTEVLTDSVPSEMKLFVIPRNIDFELQTDLKKVIFEKMLFESVFFLIFILLLLNLHAFYNKICNIVIFIIYFARLYLTDIHDLQVLLRCCVLPEHHQ